MKSYRKGAGWLFPLKGGPLDKATYRLGWNRDKTVGAALSELPERLVLTADLQYVMRPSTKKDGTQKMAAAEAGKEKVPMVEYAYIEMEQA